MSISRQKSVYRAALAVGASLGALCTVSPAMAQAESPPAGQAEPQRTATPDQTKPAEGEIIVTAQFREQRLQDIPLAITAVNSEMMRARSQTNLAQVADTAPNVSLKPQGASFGPSISAAIRGVGQNDFNPAYEPGVAIYIDDVYYPQLTGAVFDLLDLDRIEILRGPQGTLAGRNSEGGAIKMYSKKPSGDGSGYVEATFGSRGRIGVRASADFTIAKDLYARVSGVFKQQNGYVSRMDFGCVYPAGGSATFVDATGATVPVNPTGGVPRVKGAGDCKISDLGGVGYQAVRGIVRYAPADDFEIEIIGDYTHDEHTISGEVLLDAGLNDAMTNPAPGVTYDHRFICGKFCNFITTGQPAGTWAGILGTGTPLLATSGSDKSIYDGWGVSGQIRYDLSDSISLDSITGYRKFEAKFDSDDDLSPANIGFGMNDLTHWDFSQEVRLNAKPLDTVNVTIGGFYFKQSSTYFSYQDIRYVGVSTGPFPAPVLPLFPLQFLQPDVINAEAKAGFINATWEIVPNLNLSGGVRYTDESKDYHYYRLNPDGTINAFLDPLGAANGAGTPGALTGAVSTYSKSSWDYRVSLDYRFSPALMVYGTISTGFKGGGTNPRPFNANQLISFDPETLTNYEIGFKSDLFDRKVRFNVSGFYDTYSKIQIPVLTCPDSPCAARLNAGDADVKGFEAELFARPIPPLQIDASLSYLDFKFKNLDPSAMYPTNPGGAALDDPSAFPPWKATGGIQYEIPLGGDIGTLTPRFDVAYQDQQYTGPSVVNGVRNLTFIPAYTVANARLTWRNASRGLEVALEVTNLFDEYYLLNVFDLRGAGAGFKKGQPGRPREWGITLKKTF